MTPLRQRTVVVDLRLGIAHEVTAPCADCVGLDGPHPFRILPILNLDSVDRAGYRWCGDCMPEI